MSRVCLALDSRDRGEIERLVSATREHVAVFKVGLTAFATWGPQLLRDVQSARPVFADLKLHDIPVQVEGAVAAVSEAGCSYVTVHAAGGGAMVEAAKAAAGEIRILAVTVLTSLDDGDLARMGVAGGATETVLRLAELALEAGADGLVCSPLEVARVRAAFGPRASGGPLIVTPGIRSSTGGDDQRRTSSARSAVADGADLVVVGRPITAAPDPAQAARALAREVA